MSDGGFCVSKDVFNSVMAEMPSRTIVVKKKLRPGSKWLKKRVKRYAPTIELSATVIRSVKSSNYELVC